MAEYINRQAAMEVCDWYEHEFIECEYAIRLVADDLKKLPSADVAPVVRCKDCVVQRICRFAQWLGLDGCCSQGERMDGEQDDGKGND